MDAWEQRCHATPKDSCHFVGWFENQQLVSTEALWVYEYGKSRVLTAQLEENT